MAGVPANAGALVGKRLGNYELVALLALGGTAARAQRLVESATASPSSTS